MLDRKNLCERCGKHKRECMCRHGIAYECAMSVYPYEEPIKERFWAFKFRGKVGYGVYFGDRMTRLCEGAYGDSIDIVVYVPMLPKKERERGYNQAEILAKHVAAGIGREVRGILVKQRDNPEQHKQADVLSRRANVRGLFELTRDAHLYIHGKNILLVDDVLTTGATLDECARVLLAGGALSVRCLTLISV